MRQRVERRIRKRLRLPRNRILAGIVADREQRGQALEVALVEVVKSEPLWHGVAGGLLDLCQPGLGVAFFSPDSLARKIRSKFQMWQAASTNWVTPVLWGRFALL